MNSFDELFTLTQKVGEGSQSIIYECIEKDTQDKFIVKKMRNRDIESLVNLKEEYRILKNLNHPHIIKVFYLFINDKTSVSHMIF